ncbi:3-(3-hydroxy-phenyl)propionate transporter MhpT [Allorhizobium undicola]|uniref:3-(3-hydroxy-phenyl)propionate transporter MhpT n=1 Tax=Allorhizobium undicola TaxID=78527 RepID=UPI00056A8C55|nr:3-(3-hydroxy-phenyl)propionate transporter MhpT [Allorhizobium undicola]
MKYDSSDRPIGRRARSLAFLGAIIEGFDLQAAGVAAPRLIPAFKLTPEQAGLFFSSATMGLIVGALIGGRIADALGRRAGLVLSLVVFGVFSIATAFVGTFEQLVLFRFLTGIGLGGAFPNLVNISAESAPPERRGRAVATMYAGVPLGGATASGVAMLGFHGGDWQSIFVTGGILPLLLAPFVQFMLPPFEVEKTDRKSLSWAMGQIFAPERLVTTVSLWLSFFLGLIVVYLLLNWMPQLLVTRGLERSEASLVQIAFNLGGALSSFVGGGLLDRKKPALPVMLTFVAAAASLALLAFMPADFTLSLIGGTLIGLTILTVQGVLYGAAPQCYPFEIRGTGVGVAVAVGRLGSMAGPLLGGYLVAHGSSPADVILFLVPVMLLAGVFSVVLLWRRSRELQFA